MEEKNERKTITSESIDAKRVVTKESRKNARGVVGEKSGYRWHELGFPVALVTTAVVETSAK
jgi:hypothetical protein